jgi:hypothetical protein
MLAFCAYFPMTPWSIKAELVLSEFPPDISSKPHTQLPAGDHGGFGGTASLLSLAYNVQAIFSCLASFMQVMVLALCFALFKTGSNNAARIAIIAMTTSNSINVKPKIFAACGLNLTCGIFFPFAPPLPRPLCVMAGHYAITLCLTATAKDFTVINHG